MVILRTLMVILVAIITLQSQADCAPIKIVTSSEFGVTFDNPFAVFEAAAEGGSITVAGDVLRVEPETGDKLFVVVILNKQGRPVYFNAQVNGMGGEDSFEVKLADICKADKKYRAFAITSGGVARLKFTYGQKE